MTMMMTRKDMSVGNADRTGSPDIGPRHHPSAGTEEIPFPATEAVHWMISIAGEGSGKIFPLSTMMILQPQSGLLLLLRRMDLRGSSGNQTGIHFHSAVMMGNPNLPRELPGDGPRSVAGGRTCEGFLLEVSWEARGIPARRRKQSMNGWANG